MPSVSKAFAITSAPNIRSEESVSATFDSLSAPNPLIEEKEAECSPNARIHPFGKGPASPAPYPIRATRFC